MALRGMFIDLNAFFASVEQQENPALRGRPVGVAAVMAESTCCIAASYEAKRLGVKGGTRVSDARVICPQIRIVQARPQVYVKYHHRILEAIETCLPLGGIESIDEVWCPLSDAEREPAPAIVLAKQVKRAILDRVGQCMTCSIGIAPNRFLGKVASDMQKPDGLVVLTEQDLPHKLHDLKLTDLAGIGPRMFARLQRFGVRTVEQLCQQPKEEMIRIWGGCVGEHWWRWLRGEETSRRPTHKHSLSHSHVLPPEHRTMEGARAVMMRLIHRAAARLRKERYWAKYMQIYVSFSHREEGWTGSVALGLCQDTLTMIQAFNQLWQSPPPGNRPTHVGVTLLGLTADEQAPLPMFEAERNRVRLSRAMDRVNERQGANTIFFAGITDVLDTAPTRIAFSRVPELDDPDYEPAPSDFAMLNKRPHRPKGKFSREEPSPAPPIKAAPDFRYGISMP